MSLRKRATAPVGEDRIGRPEWRWMCTCGEKGQWISSKTAAQSHGTRHIKRHESRPSLGL